MIREGWLDGLDHAYTREDFIAALGRLPLDRMQDRESIGVCTAYLAMQESNLDMLRASLQAEKNRSQVAPLPRSPKALSGAMSRHSRR